MMWGRKFSWSGMDFISTGYGYGSPWIDAVNEAAETPLHVAAKNNSLKAIKAMWHQCSRRRSETPDNSGNTPLHYLADHSVEKSTSDRKKRVKMILSFLSKGIDVNRRNKYGWTIVHFAAKHCHIDLLKALDKTEADLDLVTKANETPLLLVCKNMFKVADASLVTKTIDFLLDRLFDINAVDELGYSALHYALESCSSSILTKLLKHGTHVGLRTKEHNLTPLHFAAIEKDNGLALVKILLKAGAVIESPGNDLLTPLHMALLGDSSEVVEYLIENGANVNRLDRNLQFSPLHVAIYQQRYDFFQLLVGKGADVNGSGKDGLTPLHLAAMLGCWQFTKSLISLRAGVKSLYDNHLTPLLVASSMSLILDNDEVVGVDAVKYGKERSLIGKLLSYPHNPTRQDYEVVIRLLLRNGADPNSLTKSGWSSLLFAAKTNRHTDDFLKILLKYGAEVDHREPESGFTALHFASLNNFDMKVEHLINAGADVNAMTHDGRSAVHLALRPTCIKVLKRLIENEAAIDCREAGSQLTPLHVALEKGYNDAAAFLIDAVADVNALTEDGKSPMHLALQFSDTKVLSGLLKNGAELNCKGKRCLKTFICLNAYNRDQDTIEKLHDFGKTSFQFSTDCSENREIRRLFILLSVAVDAVNKEGCTPVHSRFKSDHHKNSHYLFTEYGVKINDLDAYWKFSSDIILCGAFNELNDFQVTEYLKNYLFMLDAIKLPLSDSHKKIKSRIPEHLRGSQEKCYNKKCLDEVKKLQSYTTAGGVTLYNILHMRSSRRRFYTKTLNLDEIEQLFEIYYKLVLSRYREDTIKWTLMEAVQSALYQLTSIQVPILCVEKIFFDLNVMNIIATINAAEMVD